MLNVLYICTDWYEVEGSTYSLVNLIHAMQDDIHPIVLISNHGKVEDFFQSLGIDTIITPFFYLWDRPKPLKTVLHHPKRSILYQRLTLNKKCYKQILKYLNSTGIDIVHSNTTVTDVGVILSKKLNAKHIWHVRENLSAIGVQPYGGLKRLRKLIENANCRIVISNALNNYWNFSCRNTFIIHDAIFSKTPTINNNYRQPVVLFCATELNDFKGTPMAVEAFCRALPSGYRLILAGNCSNSYQQQLIAIAEKYNMASCLDFIGYQNNMEPYFRKASAFLMCSNFEGLGRVTLEAMAYGCPVVALASGGTIDFIQQGKTGRLFSNLNECVEMLRETVCQDNESITKEARQLFDRDYTENTFKKQLSRIYHNILS